MPGLSYSEEEAATAPRAHMRFAGTDVDVVAYPINGRDMCLLVNKGGQCVYRATLIGAFDPNLVPHMSPLINDTFPVRDLPAVRALLDQMLASTR